MYLKEDILFFLSIFNFVKKKITHNTLISVNSRLNEYSYKYEIDRNIIFIHPCTNYIIFLPKIKKDGHESSTCELTGMPT
jgi:hypothetical protein